MPQYTSVDFQFDVPVILAYPDLFVARAYEDRKTRAVGKPAFSAQFLLRPDHAELEAMRAGIRQAALNEWGSLDQVIFPVELGDAVAAKAATGDQPKDRDAFRGTSSSSLRPRRRTRLGWLPSTPARWSMFLRTRLPARHSSGTSTAVPRLWLPSASRPPTSAAPSG
jgi:hypothetical protein